jgi:hypothetical protein
VKASVVHVETFCTAVREEVESFHDVTRRLAHANALLEEKLEKLIVLNHRLDGPLRSPAESHQQGDEEASTSTEWQQVGFPELPEVAGRRGPCLDAGHGNDAGADGTNANFQ